MKQKIIKKQEETQMPMSAMIDVVFLLLIYFIITYKKSVAEAHISINLPIVNQSKTKEIQEPALKVIIKPDAILIEQKSLNLKQISNYLIEQKRILQDKLKIDIHIDNKTTQKKIIDFINLCKKYKINQFNILELK